MRGISGIPIPPKPEPVNFDSINERIDLLERSVRNIPAPEAVDLTPLQRGLGDLDSRISAIPIPRDPEHRTCRP